MSDQLLTTLKQEGIDAVISVVGMQGLSILYSLNEQGLKMSACRVDRERHCIDIRFLWIQQHARSPSKCSIVTTGGTSIATGLCCGSARRASRPRSRRSRDAAGADAVVIPKFRVHVMNWQPNCSHASTPSVLSVWSSSPSVCFGRRDTGRL